MATIPPSVRDFLATGLFAHIVTINPDGRPGSASGATAAPTDAPSPLDVSSDPSRSDLPVLIVTGLAIVALAAIGLRLRKRYI
jgi:hypothetical protein